MVRNKSGNPSRRLRLSQVGHVPHGPLNHRFARRHHVAPVESPELDAAKERERYDQPLPGGTNR